MYEQKCLYIRVSKPWEEPNRRLRDAMDVFQRARRESRFLTLLGEGDGAALCLSLAAHYAPDRLILAPVLGGDAEAFFRVLRKNNGFLFAVVCPVMLLLPESTSIREEKRFQRVLRATRSEEALIEFLPDEAAVNQRIRRECYRFDKIKTLA